MAFQAEKAGRAIGVKAPYLRICRTKRWQRRLTRCPLATRWLHEINSTATCSSPFRMPPSVFTQGAATTGQPFSGKIEAERGISTAGSAIIDGEVVVRPLTCTRIFDPAKRTPGRSKKM